MSPVPSNSALNAIRKVSMKKPEKVQSIRSLAITENTPPNNPDIVFDTKKYSADDLAAQLVGIIREQTQS